MAGRLSPVSPASETHVGDPFADRPRQTQFSEPARPYDVNPSMSTLGSTMPRPFESSSQVNVNEFGTPYDEEIEKQPLTDQHSFAGGFYPPSYVHHLLAYTICFAHPFPFIKRRPQCLW